MGQTQATTLKKITAESEQAIDFLTAISEQLQQQRRHFDDAVVTHCIRLIHDHVEARCKELASPCGDDSDGDVSHS